MVHWALNGSRGGGIGASGPAGAWLTPGERARVTALRVPKRRADWLVGRITAKAVLVRALREAFPGDWRPDAIEIASEPGGAPFAVLAPGARSVAAFVPGERLPVSVTISHAEAHALCAAAAGARGDAARPRRSVGVDLGAVEPRSPAFASTYLTDDEQRFVRDGPPWDRDLRANLVWCAKEAVLKALGLGLTVDTLDVSCAPEPGLADPAEWPLAPADGGWRPFVAACGPSVVPDGGELRGIWRTFPGFVGALAAWPAPRRDDAYGCAAGSADPPRRASSARRSAALASAPVMTWR